MKSRTTIAAIALLGLVGCATSPISYSGIVPPGTLDLYSCAVQQLNLLDYTIEGGDRETGFVRGRKQTSGLGTAILTGKNYHDVLTASVFENPATSERTLRVTAARVQENAIGIFGGNEQGISPSDSGKEDANTLLAQCGAENVTVSGRLEP